MNSVVHLTLPKDSLSGSPLDEKSKNSRSLEKKRESVDMASRCVVVDDAKKTVSLLPTARFLEYREKQRQLVLQERERERQEEAAYFAENDIPAPEEDDDYDPYQEEDEAEEEECQHILSSAPRHMRFDYISISPFLQQVFKTSVEPKIKSLVEFVARTPKPVSDIHELDGSMDFDASFSIMDEVETNISENIKSETFFIYGNNTTTDKEDLFLYLVKNTALYLNEKMKGKDTVGGCHGDGSFSVMDIYEQWGSGDVLDLGDDMHGAGRACHRSQWKAMKNGMARHSTRQSTSSLVSGGSTNSKENDRNNGQDWDGLETLLRSIRAPGCLRDNPEAQEHHRHNSTLVWTFYWTTASYNPLYIPGRGNGGASTPTSLEVSGVNDDGSFVPLTRG
ncbi:hypothetical protein ADEAN_000504100 [Angomonas deanei]|uniref:Uncharacterized protein n=1 Tax=Angomonas deanei TaxID=59799 RepID=A0A7G2CFU9_9TRYP|nr:hypothetical protein ADEAN_000504100 [Angomonas deanei]